MELLDLLKVQKEIDFEVDQILPCVPLDAWKPAELQRNLSVKSGHKHFY